MSLPEPVLALLGSELVKCPGFLFAEKGLMVVLEARIVFVGLPAQFLVVNNSVFPQRGLTVHRGSAQERGAHEAEELHRTEMKLQMKLEMKPQVASSCFLNRPVTPTMSRRQCGHFEPLVHDPNRADVFCSAAVCNNVSISKPSEGTWGFRQVR